MRQCQLQNHKSLNSNMTDRYNGPERRDRLPICPKNICFIVVDRQIIDTYGSFGTSDSTSDANKVHWNSPEVFDLLRRLKEMGEYVILQPVPQVSSNRPFPRDRIDSIQGDKQVENLIPALLEQLISVHFPQMRERIFPFSFQIIAQS